MAQVTQNFYGIVLILNHEETNEIIGAANDVNNVVKKIGKMLSDADFQLIAFVVEAIALGIQVHIWLISEVDKGDGVYLTTPWVALGTIIPTTRAENTGLKEDWIRKGSGVFRTEDAPDVISYEIQLNAIGSDNVEFRLQATNPKMWRKVLVMPDGQGSRWDIAIDPSQGINSAENGLWSSQVRNGQSLALYKAKQIGIMTWVLDIANLGSLPSGSRVLFTWLQD